MSHADDLRARLEKVIDALVAELEAIEAEAGRKRQAAVERSGLPKDLVESVLNRPLTSRDQYAQNDRMAQGQTTAPLTRIGRPLKVKGAGPITRAARETGKSLTDLAEELGTTLDAVRNWERPGRRIPDEFQPKLDALLAKHRAAKKAAK